MLAIGLAVLAVVIVGAIVFGLVSAVSGDSTGEPASTGTSAAAGPTPLPGENPEVKTPVQPPAQQAPAPTPTPSAAVVPPPVLQAGEDCPDSTLAVKGITSQPNYVIGDQPKFTMVVTN